MSFVETLNAIRGKSAKYAGKLDMILDLVENVAVAAAGVPVARNEAGELVESAASGVGLDAEQSRIILALEERVQALEARLADDASE